MKITESGINYIKLPFCFKLNFQYISTLYNSHYVIITGLVFVVVSPQTFQKKANSEDTIIFVTFTTKRILWIPWHCRGKAILMSTNGAKNIF